MNKICYFIALIFVMEFLISCNNQELSQSKKESPFIEKIINTPSDAITTLLEGNQRYIKDSNIFPHINHNRIAKTANGQTPFAAIVACSDSRVPVELIFDQGIGDLFVIRTAGNSVNDDVVKGSVEYAVEELGVKTVVIIGHESCGAVTGAIKNINPDNEIGTLLRIIRNDVKPFVGKIDSLNVAIKMNVDSQVYRIKKISAIDKLIQQGKLAVIGGYYNIHNGAISLQL